MTDSQDSPPGAFRLGYVPGVSPAKWVRTWSERRRDRALELVPVSPADAADLLRGGALDVGLLRLPTDRSGLHAVALYEEVSVVVVSRDHVLAALEPEERVGMADLDDEVLLQPADDVLDWPAPGPPGHPAAEQPPTSGLAIELVAAGIGVLVVPQSLARLHHRKDVTYRVLDGGPGAPVALAWAKDQPDDDAAADIDDFFGIVRGRTANSSRGVRRTGADDEPAAPGRAGSTGRSRPGGGSSGGGARRARGPRAGGGRRTGRRPSGGSGRGRA